MTRHLLLLIRARLLAVRGAIACRLGRHTLTARSHFTAAECEQLRLPHFPGAECVRCTHIDKNAPTPDLHPGPPPWPCGCDSLDQVRDAIERSHRVS